MFFGHFWPLLKWAVFCEAVGAVAKIEPSLKSNHHIQFYFIHETQSTILIFFAFPMSEECNFFCDDDEKEYNRHMFLCLCDVRWKLLASQKTPLV